MRALTLLLLASLAFAGTRVQKFYGRLHVTKEICALEQGDERGYPQETIGLPIQVCRTYREFDTVFFEVRGTPVFCEGELAKRFKACLSVDSAEPALYDPLRWKLPNAFKP